MMYEPGFPSEWEGLDYSSADNATPRLYGVSSGDGNNGVSHMYPEYYVRTCDPWTLARAAMLSKFEPEGFGWALEDMYVDGEAEFGISATIYNPPDDGEDCTGGEGDGEDWCSVNGAWLIVEVFREDDPASGRPQYANLRDAYSPALLALAMDD